MRLQNKILAGITIAGLCSLALIFGDRNPENMPIKRQIGDYSVNTVNDGKRKISISSGEYSIDAVDTDKNGRFNIEEIRANCPMENRLREYANPDSLNKLYEEVRIK